MTIRAPLSCHCEEGKARRGNPSLLGGCFAPRRGNGRPRPTFPFSWKSGEKSRQEPKFLHLLPRYTIYQFTTACHAFAEDFPISYRYRTLSATAPLPLAGALNNAYGSTVDEMSGSGADGMSIRHTLRKPPSPVIARQKAASSQGVQRAGSEETFGFFRCFCLLLSLLTKVGRAGARNTPIPQHKKALCYGG